MIGGHTSYFRVQKPVFDKGDFFSIKQNLIDKDAGSVCCLI
jgi:hypothetical protein